MPRRGNGTEARSGTVRARAWDREIGTDRALIGTSAEQAHAHPCDRVGWRGKVALRPRNRNPLTGPQKKTRRRPALSVRAARREEPMPENTPGPTGRFPDGKCRPDDRGELRVALWIDRK